MSGRAKHQVGDAVTQAAQDLREAVREAHEALKDLRAERRAVQELLDGLPAKVDARIEHQLAQGLDALGRETRKAIDAATEKVTAEFDHLADILMGRTAQDRRQGLQPLDDLIRQAAHHQGPVLTITESPRPTGTTTEP